jgi:hypothetical protein
VFLYYPLGHLTFAKLKQLALYGEIPKKLEKLSHPSALAVSLAQ